MTELAPQPAPQPHARGVNAFLREATLAALQTLSALASDLSDANQARLAAAEILRFASRRLPTPQSRPPRRAAAPPQRVPAYLSALSDLAGLLGQGEPQPPPQKVHASPDAASRSTPRPPVPSTHAPAPRVNAESPRPGPHPARAPLCLEQGPAAALSGQAGRAPPR